MLLEQLVRELVLSCLCLSFYSIGFWIEDLSGVSDRRPNLAAECSTTFSDWGCEQEPAVLLFVDSKVFHGLAEESQGIPAEELRSCVL